MEKVLIKIKIGSYDKDIEGFYKVATIDEIKEQDYILTLGCYVEIAEIEED